MALLAGVPAGLGLLLLAEPITATVYNYGKFTALDTRMAAISLTAMSIGIPAFMLSKVLAPAFYARQDTKTPMRAAILTVIANVLLTVALTMPLWLQGTRGAHGGIALATALAGIINAALLWRYLRRAGLYAPQPGWGRLALQLLAACAAMSAVVVGLRFWVGDWTGFDGAFERVLWLLLTIGAGALVYAAVLAVLGLRPRHLRH
jgi:putative peptidoglycan lipid II flippase